MSPRTLSDGICGRCGQPAPKGTVVCDDCQRITEAFNESIRNHHPWDGIERERDERGHYEVSTTCEPISLMWWKFIFDTKTPTWQKFGCVTFVQAADEGAARVAGAEAAAVEFPGAQILPHDIGESTPAAAEAFAEKRRRLALWQENVRTGVPNTPDVLTQPILTERDERGGYKVPYPVRTPMTDRDALTALSKEMRADAARDESWSRLREKLERYADQLDAALAVLPEPPPTCSCSERADAEPLKLNRYGRRCYDAGRASALALSGEGRTPQRCKDGHVWTHNYGDDWMPDVGSLCDCGQRRWGCPSSTPTAPKEPR